MVTWQRKRNFRFQSRISGKFSDQERVLLGGLSAIVAELLIDHARSAPQDELAELTGMPLGHTSAPENPALARLLPDFERSGDEEYEGDNALLRSLHEKDITGAKLFHLMEIIESLGPSGGTEVHLSTEEAERWLFALGDLRLVLHAAIGANPSTFESAAYEGAELEQLREHLHHLINDVFAEDLAYEQALAQLPNIHNWLAFTQELLLETMYTGIAEYSSAAFAPDNNGISTAFADGSASKEDSDFLGDTQFPDDFSGPPPGRPNT